MQLKVIATIRTDFKTKFGIPRQSGLADVDALIVFNEPYKNRDALRGIEDYSHLWLIWQFSQNVREEWSPTVRPPRLGGNTRVGVFATRSSFRPNALGLSSVRLLGVVETPEGCCLKVRGADLMDGTPIYDIKPYLPFTDAHPDAVGGFTRDTLNYRLEVVFCEELLAKIPAEKRRGLCDVLSQDPRPSYQNDPARIYGMPFDRYDVKFRVENGILTVVAVDIAKGEEK